MLTCPSPRISLLCLKVLKIVMANIKASKVNVRAVIDIITIANVQHIMQRTLQAQKRTSSVGR